MYTTYILCNYTSYSILCIHIAGAANYKSYPFYLHKLGLQLQRQIVHLQMYIFSYNIYIIYATNITILNYYVTRYIGEIPFDQTNSFVHYRCKERCSPWYYSTHQCSSCASGQSKKNAAFYTASHPHIFPRLEHELSRTSFKSLLSKTSLVYSS